MFKNLIIKCYAYHGALDMLYCSGNEPTMGKHKQTNPSNTTISTSNQLQQHSPDMQHSGLQRQFNLRSGRECTEGAEHSLSVPGQPNGYCSMHNHTKSQVPANDKNSTTHLTGVRMSAQNRDVPSGSQPTAKARKQFNLRPRHRIPVQTATTECQLLDVNSQSQPHVRVHALNQASSSETNVLNHAARLPVENNLKDGANSCTMQPIVSLSQKSVDSDVLSPKSASPKSLLNRETRSMAVKRQNRTELSNKNKNASPAKEDSKMSQQGSSCHSSQSFEPQLCNTTQRCKSPSVQHDTDCLGDSKLHADSPRVNIVRHQSEPQAMKEETSMQLRLRAQSVGYTVVKISHRTVSVISPDTPDRPKVINILMPENVNEV